MSLLRLPLKGPLENELNGNEKWHHYYCSSIADVSILQITFLATLRGFSLNTTSFTVLKAAKKLMAQKFPYMALSKLLAKQETVFTADFMIAIVPKKWKLEKEKKFAFESLVMNLS